MVLLVKLYPADEFFEIAQVPENDEKRLELDDGVIIEVAGSSPANTVIVARISHYLNAFVIPNNLGYVTGADGAFVLSERRVRLPDAAFVAKNRVEKLPSRFNFAPDLAVEVVSPDEDVFKKANEYLRARTKMVWAVYEDEQRVYVMRLTADGTLNSSPNDMDDTLDGDEVLPGFTLPVRDIFPD